MIPNKHVYFTQKYPRTNNRYKYENALLTANISSSKRICFRHFKVPEEIKVTSQGYKVLPGWSILPNQILVLSQFVHLADFVSVYLPFLHDDQGEDEKIDDFERDAMLFGALGAALAAPSKQSVEQIEARLANNPHREKICKLWKRLAKANAEAIVSDARNEKKRYYVSEGVRGREKWKYYLSNETCMAALEKETNFCRQAR